MRCEVLPFNRWQQSWLRVADNLRKVFITIRIRLIFSLLVFSYRLKKDGVLHKKARTEYIANIINEQIV